jgi:hypothetical protein
MLFDVEAASTGIWEAADPAFSRSKAPHAKYMHISSQETDQVGGTCKTQSLFSLSACAAGGQEEKILILCSIHLEVVKAEQPPKWGRRYHAVCSQWNPC